MVKRFTVVFVVSLFVLFVFAGGALAAAKVDKKHSVSETRDISQEATLNGSEEGSLSSPMQKYSIYSSKGPEVTCEDIHPGMGDEYIARHDQMGHTWYEFQKNGSMGRMMSITSAGVRHFSWMFTNGVYGGTNYRYVDANEMNAGGVYVGQQHVDGGANKNAGYSNQAHLGDGKSVVSYHRTAGQIGDPVPDAMLAIEDAVGTATFTRHWDIPDSILNSPSSQPGEWPKIAVQYDDVSGKEYIHIVMTESELTGGYPCMQAYIRCYLDTDPNYLICETPRPGAAPVVYTLNKNVNYSNPHNTVSHFDTTCSITATPHVSPVSKRVAVVYLPPCECDGSCDYFSDIAFIESMNCGNDWVDGTNYPPLPYNVTNYPCIYPTDYKAYHDHGACYDYNDSLHIVWVTVATGADPGTFYSNQARLWHWSKAAGASMITSNITGGVTSGAHNASIAKTSISAKDPAYHPGGDPDSVYLFCIWSQFDSADMSDKEYTNSEIYGAGSNDGGKSWGSVWDLTRTHTPDCTPDNCVSEHWSSLAENMYDGDLHIMYVCDRYAGAAIQDNTDWGDTYMYYLHLKEWDVGARCEGAYTRVEPTTFHKPAMKMAEGETKILTLNVANVGNLQMPYTATASDPQGCVTGSYSDILDVAEDVDLTFTVSAVSATCSGEDDGNMIIGGIELTTCDETVTIPVHAVVAEDYYECPTDPETYDTVETSALRLFANANSLEWIDDISSWPDTVHNVFFQGGSFVATSIDGNKVVGRWYGDNDWRAGVRDKLYYDYCVYDTLEAPAADYNCHVLYTKNIFIHYPPTPPYIYHCYWWWWEWSKVIKICELPDFRKIVIKYIRVKRHDPPTWWPDSDPIQGPYDGHEDTYIGMMMDVDCPYDTLGSESARNIGGYETGDEVAWIRGYYHAGDPEGHPEFENYYAGMALADPSGGGDIVPYAAHIIKNNYYLYPQSPWGWDDEEFYDLTSTAGNTNQDSDSLVDRSIVITAKHIPAGNEPDADYSFVVVEVMSKDGKDAMLALIDTARAIVAREKQYHGFPVICGDVNGNGLVDLGDAVYLLTYLFKNTPTSPKPGPLCPFDRGDVKANGLVDLGDVVYLLTYLFKNTPSDPKPPPDCPGLYGPIGS